MRKYRKNPATVLISSLLLSCAMQVGADAGFRNWIDNFRSDAISQGVAPGTYDKAFRGVLDIDPVVIEKANFQPEFKAEVWEYMDNRVQERSIATGRDMLKQYSKELATIERNSGVDRHVLLAIWSMETSYGAALQKPDSLHYIPRALATLAIAHGEPLHRGHGGGAMHVGCGAIPSASGRRLRS